MQQDLSPKQKHSMDSAFVFNYSAVLLNLRFVYNEFLCLTSGKQKASIKCFILKRKYNLFKNISGKL